MFKKKEKHLKKKKIRTVKVGTHKKTVIILWLVLIGSVSFGIYKNFTAIDQHTTTEKEIIQLRLSDTNSIENFVENFAKSYHAWDNSKETIEKRTMSINEYLTKELQDLNIDTIRIDIPTSSSVNDVLIWDVEQSGKDEFIVTYEIDQQINEDSQTKAVKGTYLVRVHVDKEDKLVIVQNPTLAKSPEKSTYEPKASEPDGTVDADVVQEATAFLETFFKLYPSATEKELAYYVQDDVLQTVYGDYLFSELINPVFSQDGSKVKVEVAVEYIDNQTKATLISQYSLNLIKKENWMIVQ